MAAVVSDEVKVQVVNRLVSVLQDPDDEDSGDNIARVIFFLDKTERSDSQPSPYWRNFKALLKTDKAFKMYAKRLANETKTAEENPEYIASMKRIHQAFLEFSEKPLPEDAHQRWDVVRLRKDPVFAVGHLQRCSGEVYKTLASIARNIANDKKLAVTSSADEVVGSTLTSQRGAHITMGVLALTYLSYEAVCSIRRWRKGEISGKRCAKNIVDKGLATLGAMAGGVLGSMTPGPVGYAARGIIGGIVAAGIASFIADRLTQYFFDLPQDEALENAYRFLGVKHTASNTEVNSAFHKLCLKHHPDKGGEAEDFYKVQASMQLIREAREVI